MIHTCTEKKLTIHILGSQRGIPRNLPLLKRKGTEKEYHAYTMCQLTIDEYYPHFGPIASKEKLLYALAPSANQLPLSGVGGLVCRQLLCKRGGEKVNLCCREPGA